MVTILCYSAHHFTTGQELLIVIVNDIKITTKFNDFNGQSTSISYQNIAERHSAYERHEDTVIDIRLTFI